MGRNQARRKVKTDVDTLDWILMQDFLKEFITIKREGQKLCSHVSSARGNLFLSKKIFPLPSILPFDKLSLYFDLNGIVFQFKT
jgi:hypothetical protein